METMNDMLNACDDAAILTLFNKYEQKWDIQAEHLTDPKTIIEQLSKKFDIDPQNPLESIEITFKNQNKAIIEVGTQLRMRGLMDSEDNTDMLLKFNRLLERIHYSFYMINNFLHFKNTFALSYTDNSDMSFFKYIPLIYDDLKPFQKLIYKLFYYFESNNFRKVNDWVYTEITTGDENQYRTHAWKPFRPIIDIIHEQCALTSEVSNWILFTTNKDMDTQLNDYFVKTKDKRFPELTKDRHVFSYENGIYFAVDHDTKNKHLSDRFVEYTSEEFKRLDKGIVAAKYFNQPFQYKGNIADFRKIPTPSLDSIFKYQQIPEDAIDICYMFLGRMLHNVGELDNWQIIPFLIGIGGSGKSTINNVIRQFYNHEDVGVMSNNYQKIFGLSDIYTKFIFIAPEIKKDWTIDQAEFQEMVSGGKVNVNIKHKSSVVVQWTTPGMLAGNENPGFVDNASSIQRRVVVTRFDQKVENGDPHLDKKLKHEMDCIMRKCNLAYLHFVNTYQNIDFWKFAPSYYLETQKLMASASNSLYAYLESDMLDIKEDGYMPMDEFFKMFNKFCSENNFKKPTINIDFYRAPFQKYGITVETKATKRYPPINGTLYRNTTFLYGVDFKCLNETSMENYEDEF